MTIENIFQDFIERFPEMSEEVKHYYDAFVTKEHGIAYAWKVSVILAIFGLFDTEEDVKRNEDLLQRIFDFFEEMTYSNDVNVINLLMDYTFEPFTCDFNKYGGIKKFLGKRSMILYRIACQTTYPPLEEFDEIGPAYLKHYYAEGEQSWENCYLDFIDEWVRKSEEEKSKNKEEKLD